MIVNRLAEEKVFDAGGACRSQRRNYYDGQASEQTPPTKGLLTKVEAAQDACGGGFVTQVQNSYDPTWHNLTRSQDGLGHGLTTVYDNEFHVFVSTQSNDLSQTTTTTYPPADVVQRALGLPSQTTDANNQVASYTYDGFGRPLTVNRPLGHASVDEQWVYTDYSSAASPRRVLHKLYDEVTTPANPESGYLAEWTFYDGLGREVQRQGEHESDANKSILVSQSYDGQGRLERTSVGYEYGGAPGTYRAVTNWNGVAHSRNEYDSLGRVVRVVGPDGADGRYEYRYLQTASFDALDHLVISEEDGLGRTKAVREYEGVYPTLNWNSLPGAYSTTSYEYDVLDRLERVVGADGAVIDPSYNLLGEKTGMSDPDMGAWSYGYDGAGNLTRQTDARGTVLCYEYDALNRLRYVREDQTAPKDCTGTLAWRTTHEYDTLNWQPVANGIGRRNRLNDGSGTTTWAYDVRGRATSETKAIGGTGGGTFVTQWTYDAADRVKTMTYPGGNNSQAGEVVNFTYNPQGLVETMVGTSTYVASTTYNALGQTTDRWLGSNGVVRQHYDYTAAENFRLTGLQSGVSPNYNTLQNLSYTYDDAGNVLTITDAAAVGGSQTQTFTYDALNRLATATASGTPPNYGAYNQVSYAYSNAGNLTSFEGAAFTYEDGAHKHAVTHLGSAQKYWYDANGNASTRISGSQTTNLSYDAENRMIRTVIVSGTTTDFTYDGDGRLVKMKVGSTYTAIAGPHYQYSGSTPTQHYYAGGVRVGQRYNTTLLFHLTDHLGSTNLTTNASGVLSAELRYRPYGLIRYTTGTLNTPYRYTGQRFVQNTGLYFYNARWYDPTIGRFLAADTVVPEPGNPGSLNRYSYVLNNPIKYADPSGHAECAAGDMACWQNEWKWKNRWYNAHGWFDSGNGWTQKGEAVFADEGILDELFAEAGITLEATNAVWTFDRKAKVGSGIARFGQALQGGIAQLRELLGGVTRMILQPGSPVICRGGAVPCAPPTLHNKVWVPADWLDQHSSLWVGTQVVHELAHVIDWHKGFSGRWHGAPITDYAACGGSSCVNRWERWAEAVTVFVYGGEYEKALIAEGFGGFRIKGAALQVQMDRIGDLLNGVR